MGLGHPLNSNVSTIVREAMNITNIISSSIINNNCMGVGVERQGMGRERVEIDDTVSFVWGYYFEVDDGLGSVRIVHEMS